MEQIPTASSTVKQEQLKLLGHIFRAPQQDYCHNICFTKAYNRRDFGGPTKRGPRRRNWLETVTEEAWHHIQQSEMGAPINSPQPPPLRRATNQTQQERQQEERRQQHSPPQPHFYSPHYQTSPFLHSPTLPHSIIPLRVVSQYRTFWRNEVVLAPTRICAQPTGGEPVG